MKLTDGRKEKGPKINKKLNFRREKLHVGRFQSESFDSAELRLRLRPNKASKVLNRNA